MVKNQFVIVGHSDCLATGMGIENFKFRWADLKNKESQNKIFKLKRFFTEGFSFKLIFISKLSFIIP